MNHYFSTYSLLKQEIVISDKLPCSDDYFSLKYFNSSFAEIIANHEKFNREIIQVDNLKLYTTPYSFNPNFGTFSKKFAHFLSSKINKRSKVLDLGCGIGYIGLHLSKLNADVTGVDIQNINQIVSLNSFINNTNMKFINEDIVELKAKYFKDKFDFIVANLPFSRIDLLLNYIENPFFDCFASPRGFTESFIRTSLDLIKVGGEFLFCYGSSGWLDEIKPFFRDKRLRVTVYLDEKTESLSERRYIFGIKKITGHNNVYTK